MTLTSPANFESDHGGESTFANHRKSKPRFVQRQKISRKKSMEDATNMAGSVNRVRRPVAMPKAAKLKKPPKKLSLKFVTNPERIMTMRANKLVVARE